MGIMKENHQIDHDSSTAASLKDVVCPFCAMVCDDLSLPVDRKPHAPDSAVCPKAAEGFRQALDTTHAAPLVRGHEAGWPEALQRTRELMQSARLPLFHGLIGDLLDCRAALHLAGHFRGVVDHHDGDTVARNLAVYQDSGWISTSLGETRNRADLVILIGDDIGTALPRLNEKLFAARERLHTPQEPHIVVLNTDRLSTLDQVRVMLGSRPLPEPRSQAVDLYEKLHRSSYPVFVVAALDDARAELVLRSTADLVRTINESRRAALLTLSSGVGDTTAQLASTWHNGFGIRTSFARGYPEQDLQRFAAHRLLHSNESDLLVWINSLSRQPPPECQQPRIVIGHPAMRFDDDAPDVFLPVAVPGVHRNGFLHRADGLRMLPLQAAIESNLPGTLEVCRQLTEPTAEN